MTRVLVADDYLPFLEEARQLALGTSIEVSTARSSQEAVDALKAGAFDLVITDLFMETNNPKDGFAVISEAKKSDFTQVIAITAYGTPEICLEALRLGVFDYLERGTPGGHFRALLRTKILQALEFRDAKVTIAQRDLP